jgi:AP-1 complex subunit beta-1
LLQAFIEEFTELDVEVQLQLLTATVKLFLKKPATTQGTVKEVLQLATTKSSNPDLRDRGYIYWRLLSTDPEKARVVVLAEPVTVEYDSNRLDKTLLETLLRQVASLASVYHKPPQSFLIDSARQAGNMAAPAAMQEDETGVQTATAGGAPGGSGSQGLDVLDLMNAGADSRTGFAPPAQKPAVVDDLLDLLGDIGGPGGGGGGGGGGAGGASATPGGVLDLMGGMSLAGVGGNTGQGGGGQVLKTLLSADKGGGMEVKGAVSRRGGKVVYDLEVRNSAGTPLSGIALQFNKNFMGLTNAAPLQVGTIGTNSEKYPIW